MSTTEERQQSRHSASEKISDEEQGGGAGSGDSKMSRSARYYQLNAEKEKARRLAIYHNDPEVIRKREEREAKKAAKEAEKEAKRLEKERVRKEKLELALKTSPKKLDSPAFVK